MGGASEDAGAEGEAEVDEGVDDGVGEAVADSEADGSSDGLGSREGEGLCVETPEVRSTAAASGWLCQR